MTNFQKPVRLGDVVDPRVLWGEAITEFLSVTDADKYPKFDGSNKRAAAFAVQCVKNVYKGLFLSDRIGKCTDEEMDVACKRATNWIMSIDFAGDSITDIRQRSLNVARSVWIQFFHSSHVSRMIVGYGEYDA